MVTTKYFGEHFVILSSPTLLSRSIKWYLSQETTLTDNCRMQLIDFTSSLNKGRRWALEMYDAMGKLPAGILNGNFIEMGSFDQCINIDEIRNDSTRLIGKYCLGHLSIPSEYIKQTEQLPNYVEVPTQMHFSVCFPNSCSAADIEEIANGIELNLTLTDEVCQTKETQVQITAGGWVTLGISVVILILMIASTIYELTWKGSQPHWALKSFSVRTNGKLIFDIAKPDPNQVSCIYGLRTITMMGVISFHVYYQRFSQPITNSYYISYWKRQIKNLPLYNPILIVDVFFLISGFLVSYMFLQKSSRGYKFNFISHYLGRYLRVTPPVLVILLFELTWFEYIGSGPIWNSLYDEINVCRTYWWSYLLYIQNWTSGTCLPPTWYLSVDFQLFIFSPFLLIPLKRWPKATLVATSCLTLLSLLTTFVMVWINKTQGILSGITVFTSIYYSFFLPTRASAWLIGFMLGYIIFETNRGQGKTVLKKRLVIPLFVAAVIVIIVCIFGTYHIFIAPYNRVETTMCLTLTRPAFAISLGYIVYCCHLGYIGVVNTFLSNPLFEVLSRLSFNVYLIHYFVVQYNISSIRVAPFVNNFTFMINDIPGVTFLSLIIAVLLSLSVELPAQHFVNFLVKRIQEMGLSKSSKSSDKSFTLLK
ncbi:hypothetical protein RI129_008427 [Pyrocoelia pectoralis]|uniref:Nose resistant-to-fluoxetine protein N-terminal domain-containing protein n=1 Tax=Pyrocoelia pectoralis TaxID=417401 RepID=A0AAN7ZDP3_9COLE